MRKIFLAPLLLFSTLYLAAQDPAIRALQDETYRPIKSYLPDTIKKSWRAGGIYNLSAGQGTLSNWAAGGDDYSLTINSLLNLFAGWKKGRNSWDNNLDVSIGYLKTTSLGSRKNDDRFDLLSKYGYSLNHKLNLTTLFDFRSQFLKGYSYSDTSKTFSSSFLAPAYVLISLGLDYKPAKNLSIFFSPVTSRWVIVNNAELAAKGSYGVDSFKKSINQLGAFSTINYVKEINKFVVYRARMDLFSNYKKKPKNVDFYMTNILSVKLAKVFSINWSVDMIYDDDVHLFGKLKTSPSLQLKSIIGVGLLLKFHSHFS